MDIVVSTIAGKRDGHSLQRKRFPYLPRTLVVVNGSRFNTGNSGKTAFTDGVIGRRHGLCYRSQVKNRELLPPNFMQINEKDTN